MKTVLLLLLMGLALGRVWAQPSTAPEKRLALVIGNSRYATTSALPTARNDATDMAATLKELGFEVMLYTDLEKKSLQKAVNEFGSKLKGYQVGLFFYAGHGIALTDLYYLIPVDATLQKADDIEFNCFPMNQVLTTMEQAQTTTNIVLLDADRNSIHGAGPSHRSGSGGGLASEVTAGLITAYATSPGGSMVASTGRNSIYTSALLSTIKSPGLSIEELFRRVRLDVQKQTDNRQRPWEASSLTQEFYFLKK